MKNHTRGFKENVKVLGKELDSKITYFDDKTQTTKILINEEIISITPVTNTNLLKSVMKEADFESSVQVSKGTIVNIKSGIKVGGSYEYIDYGNYEVYDNQYNADTKSYQHVCYDKMLNTMIPYQGLEEYRDYKFPMNVNVLINLICLVTGISISNKLYRGDFLNGDYVIKEEYFNENYTFRDVLHYLSQLIGGFIYINDEDKLDVKYITDTHEVFNKEYLKDTNITFNKKYGPVNSILFSSTNGVTAIEFKDEASIERNGLTQLEIKANPFLQDDDTTYCQRLFDSLNGLYYYIIDVESTGIMFLDFGDIYYWQLADNPLYPSKNLYPNKKLYPRKSETYKCLMLNDEINITQGLSENIYNEEPQENINEYSTSAPKETDVKDAIIQVKKNTAEIELKVYSNNIISAINLSPEEISILSKKIKLEGYTTINGAFNVDLEGNMSCNNATVSNVQIVGGSIKGTTLDLSDETASNPAIKVTNKSDNNRNVSLSSNLFQMAGGGHTIFMGTDDSLFQNDNIFTSFDDKFKIYSNGNISNTANYNCGGNITCVSLTQTSLESKKKNFEKFNKGLELIMSSDFYLYNFKNESNKNKKHIGLVIPDVKGNFKTPKEFLNSEENAVELYSLISACAQAIQTQQETIKSLEKRLSFLERGEINEKN